MLPRPLSLVLGFQTRRWHAQNNKHMENSDTPKTLRQVPFRQYGG